jgi:hypothetical protein
MYDCAGNTQSNCCFFLLRMKFDAAHWLRLLAGDNRILLLVEGGFWSCGLK